MPIVFANGEVVDESNLIAKCYSCGWSAENADDFDAIDDSGRKPACPKCGRVIKIAKKQEGN